MGKNPLERLYGKDKRSLARGKNYKRLYGKMSDNRKTYDLEGNTAPEKSQWRPQQWIVKYRALASGQYQGYYQPRYYPENVRERLEICTRKSARV